MPHLRHQRDVLQLALDLVSNLGGGILGLRAFIVAQAKLLCPDLLGLLRQRGDGRQVKVRVEMPEEGAGDAHEGPVGELGLALLDGLDGPVVDDDLVEPGLDEPPREVLDLLAGLDEEVVAGGDLDGDAAARVARPHVQAGVSGAAVDGEEVEVGVEAGEDRVFGAVFYKIGGGGSQEMGSALKVSWDCLIPNQ